MKTRIRYRAWIPRILRVDGITLYPFVLVRWAEDGILTKATVRHELIHVEQVRRDGVVTFYAKYLWAYLKGLVKFRSHAAAYRAIPYEREAYGDTGGNP